jgi:hypothetical protein
MIRLLRTLFHYLFLPCLAAFLTWLMAFGVSIDSTTLWSALEAIGVVAIFGGVTLAWKRAKGMKRLIVIAIVTIISLAAFVALFGLTTDPGFLANIVSELFGIVIGVLFTVFLVDRLLKSERKRQWTQVRSYTLEAIARHLSDFTWDVFYTFELEDRSGLRTRSGGQNAPYQALFTATVDQLRAIPNAMSPTESTSDRTVTFYDQSQWDLDQIQTVLLPRLIQSQVDEDSQEVIDALIEFDQARRDLHNSVITDKLISIQSAFPALISLIETAGKLYKTIFRHLEE